MYLYRPAMFGQFGTVSPVHKDKTKSPNVWPIYKLLYLESYDSWIIPINVEYKSSGDGKARVIDTGYFLQIKLQQSNSLLTESSEPILHNGENDSHKRQFLALGVHSQSWILDNLSKKKFLVKLTGVTGCLLQFDRKCFCSVMLIAKFPIFETR